MGYEMIKQALIMDTETTGLVDNHTLKLDKQPEVIEFYGNLVDLDSGDVLGEYHHLFKPKRKLEEEIIKITGLTDAELAKYHHFNVMAAPIKVLLESQPCIIGHNLSFDTEMLDLEFERLGAKVKWPLCICTVEQTVHLKGHRLSQSALHEFLFEEGFADAHRAKPDVQALTRIVLELRKRNLI